MIKIKLLKRRNRLGLTWFSRLILLAAFIVTSFFIIKNLNKFLSLNKPLSSPILVIEGFLPDYTLKNMLQEFYTKNYEKIVITGKPIGQGYYLKGFLTSADLMRATLIQKMGVDSNLIVTISIPETVKRDRTYSTGLLFSQWLDNSSYKLNQVNVYTLGCHARRSKVLFQAALGEKVKVGIIAGEDRSYDQVKWWKASKGFRTVFNEALAYMYVKLFFKAERERDLKELNDSYYIDQIQRKRNEKDFDFSMNADSPLTVTQKKKFIQLKYFPIDEKYKIKAYFKPEPGNEVVNLSVSNETSLEYIKAGKLYFLLDSTQYHLTAFKKHDEDEELLIPFKDLSCGKESFVEGRYYKLPANVQDSIWLDFNNVYNPYKAYNAELTSLKVPEYNYLSISIRAGEKCYKTP